MAAIRDEQPRLMPTPNFTDSCCGNFFARNGLHGPPLEVPPTLTRD
jgi:hypothetical protein